LDAQLQLEGQELSGPMNNKTLDNFWHCKTLKYILRTIAIRVYYTTPYKQSCIGGLELVAQLWTSTDTPSSYCQIPSPSQFPRQDISIRLNCSKFANCVSVFTGK